MASLRMLLEESAAETEELAVREVVLKASRLRMLQGQREPMESKGSRVPEVFEGGRMQRELEQGEE